MELQPLELRGTSSLIGSGTSASRRKTKDRLNDQILPKPCHVNMGEKMIKVAFPKEHPYASHISRYAMFPSFKCPDDPDSGVRASSQPFLTPHVPKAAPEVSVLSKCIGGPYRLEVVESAAGRGENALAWPGHRGFWDYAKPMTEESQVWYPTPPKTILPNPKLRDWEGTLSERTSNMLKNLEKALWITSYHMHYTGSGPARPLQIDDFREKISDPSGTSSHAAPLRERSHPVFIPSKPRRGRRRRHESFMQLSPSSASKQGSPSATVKQCRSPEITTESNEEPVPNKLGHSISQGAVEVLSSGFPQEVMKKDSRDRFWNVGAHQELQLKSGLLPRPPVLPGIQQSSRTNGSDPQTLLQPFSKSEAHRRFNVSTARPLVNLNDNVVSGRKHNFYGVNCNFLH
ncbi:sperm-associated microtubule inner protein 4 [Synchiropus picturatus]